MLRLYYSVVFFLALIALSDAARAQTTDPVRFTMETSASIASIGEEIEITVKAECLDFPSNTVFVFKDYYDFQLKVMVPDGFKQTGGTFSQNMEVALSPRNRQVCYILKGKFIEPSNTTEFLLLMRNRRSGEHGLYVAVTKLKYIAKNFESVETAAREESMSMVLAANPYIPYVTMDEFRQTSDTTINLFYLNEGKKSGYFSFSPAEPAPDDSATVLTVNGRKYVRRVEAEGTAPASNTDAHNQDGKVYLLSENGMGELKGGYNYIIIYLSFVIMDNYQGYTDSALLALIADGDELAFGEVYRRYKGVLFLHARRILGNDEEGKDVLQELFTTLWIRRNSIDLKTNLSAYLYTSVRNRVFDIIAHRKVEERYIASLATFIEKGEYFTDQQLLEQELKEVIEKEIALLPPKMREVFELSRKQELSYKEIADQLHISDKTVKKQVNNALHILRKKLDTVFISLACYLFL